jgi:hypothetical protein
MRFHRCNGSGSSPHLLNLQCYCGHQPGLVVVTSLLCALHMLWQAYTDACGWGWRGACEDMCVMPGLGRYDSASEAEQALC